MNGLRLGIAGIGLIGGSIALAAASAGACVAAFDHDAAALADARARGAIARVAPSLAELAAESDALVIALPVDAALAALAALDARHAPHFVIDVASVKAPFAHAAARLPHYVGTHPIAGREVGGFAAADAGLFAGATWTVSPHTDAALRARVKHFIVALGAVPLELAPADHDAIVALTSHLPQALSVALGAQLAAAIDADPRVAHVAGTGLRSMLRLARSPEDVWAPIVDANREALARALHGMAERLERAASGLEKGDRAPLMSYFHGARRAVAAFDELSTLPERFSIPRDHRPSEAP